ncbi:class I SAM-dependent methyltransferase [Sphingomonas sp. BIUV-7]|uniref:Class I SAM-dependent methyltransferase n=1 Tax=Sphingomonas natans TaxID=3063330 RepID=A0ABT8Y5W7_9SPHN|nr:class I SAM-dependent methyltransferase [Sphingomonas sp. BIUV-7]MDO6413308.1 class I SAM-dependent methyltransferase [Sphingomonas sp. BIUV-7]
MSVTAERGNSARSGAIRFLARLANMIAAGGIARIGERLRARFGADGRAYRQSKRADDRSFDAAGYDTGGIQRLYGLDVIGPHAAAGINHIATPAADFAAALALLDIPIPGSSFVDLGSGKGRAVLMATDHPFAAITGVEFARELHEIALANLARRAERHGSDARIVLLLDDATRFRLPSGPIVLFLFNPFDPPVLTEVAAATTASWQADPRPIRILYLNPVHQQTWRDAGWRELPGRPGLVIFAPPHDGDAG